MLGLALAATDSGSYVPLLSGLAVLLTAVATLLGVLVTRAAGRRTSSAADIRVLLDERRADRAEDRLEIERLDTLLRNSERNLLVSRTLEQALRQQLLAAGLVPHDESRR